LKENVPPLLDFRRSMRQKHPAKANSLAFILRPRKKKNIFFLLLRKMPE